MKDKERTRLESSESVISVLLSSRFDEDEGILREAEYPFISSTFLIPEGCNDEAIEDIDSGVSSILKEYCTSRTIYVGEGASFRTSRMYPIIATG